MLPDPITTTSAGRKRKRQKRQVIETNTREKSIAKGRDPIISLNMNLDYLGKSGQRGAAARAKEMLLRIEALHAEGYYEITPDTVSYNSVMNAYAIAATRDGEAAKEAQQLLGRMEEMALNEAGGDGSSRPVGIVRPNAISFNTVILALANSGQPDKAEELLSHMEDICLAIVENTDSNSNLANGCAIGDDAPISCMPNTITYNSCILAWAKAGDPHRAENLLKRMMELSLERNDDDLKADCISVNTVLHAWAVSRQRGAAEHAESLLRHMETLYLSGNEDVQPDKISYTSVIAAWASSKHSDAANRALKLLQEMEELYEAGEECVRPNSYTYTAVINALARSRLSGSAQKALEILSNMHELHKSGRRDCKPDVVCYTSVIDAYSRSGDKDAAENAVALLSDMIERVEAGDEDLKPNERTYCAVITALGRTGTYGAAESAEKLLEDMERMHAFGNREVKPTTAVFNAVIDAYARSSYKRKAENAHHLLLRMLEESSEGAADVRPDVISYNSVLKTCANAYGSASIRKRAFLIALDTFKRLFKSNRIRRTSVTYSVFFKAIRKLVENGEERDAITRKMFDFCIADGVLNRQVLSQVQAACSDTVLTELLASNGVDVNDVAQEGGKIHMKDLPSGWTCNARR